MSARCESFELELRRAASGASGAISDALALHLDACPACRRTFDRGVVPLDSEGFERVDPLTRDRMLRVPLGAPRSRHRLVVAAAAAVIVTLGIAALAIVRSSPVPGPPVAVALVEDHIRYLADASRSARPSEDLVRDLEAYVDFPVSLPEANPAKLTGVRRCYLLGRRVVLAFYEHDAARLSYFVLPANGLSLPGETCGADDLRCAEEQGYAAVIWRRGGLLHGAVAADRADALQFAQATSRSLAK